MYEQVKHIPISDISNHDLNEWISDEIIGLANDVAHNMPDDLAQHTSYRIKGLLTTQFKSWAAGDVHSAWQVGLTGENVHKITVQKLIKWLKQAQTRRAVTVGFKSASAPRTAEPLQAAKNDNYGHFMCWLTINRIYIDELFPEQDFTKKEVPQCMRDLQNEYNQAKEMDMLPALARRLKNNYKTETV